MRVSELAAKLGVSDFLLRRLANQGIIPAKRLPIRGSHWRFSEAEVPKIREVLVNAGLIEEPPPKKKK